MSSSRLSIPNQTPTYNDRVALLNMHLAQQFCNKPWAMFWEHPPLRNEPFAYLSRDGIHLTAAGNYKLYHSYCMALETACRQIISHP